MAHKNRKENIEKGMHNSVFRLLFGAGTQTLIIGTKSAF